MSSWTPFDDSPFDDFGPPPPRMETLAEKKKRVARVKEEAEEQRKRIKQANEAEEAERTRQREANDAQRMLERQAAQAERVRLQRLTNKQYTEYPTSIHCHRIFCEPQK